MKNLIIIGAGGMGREVYNLAIQCRGYGIDFVIKGFIDDNLQSLDKYKNYPAIISTINDYIIEKDDVFACSIGNVQLKKMCINIILEKEGVFYSLIHPTALINDAAKIGKGCIIFPYAQVGSGAIVGEYSLIQSFAGVSHDVIIGNFVRLDVHTLCVGGVIIGDLVTIHSGAIINHKVIIEDNSVVGAMSFVIRKVKKGCTVYGNPAKILIEK